MKKKSTRARVLTLLSATGHTFTAQDIVDILLDVKLSSLSSELCKMANAGMIKRVPGHGPRGGNGYKFVERVERPGTYHGGYIPSR